MVVVTMKIYVGEIEIDAGEDDDLDVVLQRYAIKTNALVSFFRAVDPNIIIAKGVRIKIEDVRDELSSINLDDKTTIDALISRYPKLKRRELGILWILNRLDRKYVKRGKVERTIPDATLRSLSVFDPHRFTTWVSINEEIDFLNEVIAKQNAEFTANLKTGDRIFRSLSRVDPVTVSPFRLEDVVKIFTLRLPDQESLFDIFDAMDVSYNLPFVMMIYRGESYFKIYQNLPVEPLFTKDKKKGWVDEIPQQDGIYFKILNAPTRLLSSKRVTIGSLYSSGRWGPDNVVTLSFKAQHRAEDEMWEKLVSVFGGRLRYEIVSARQSSIRGTFEISEIEFDRTVFADMVVNDPDFRYFLFLEESLKPVLSKEKLRVFFSPGHTYSVATSLALTFTQNPEIKNRYEVRVIRASDVQVAERVVYVISKLMRLYLDRKDDISAIYSNFIRGISTAKPRKEVTVKVDRKKGDRLALLQDTNPSLFKNNYSNQCQKYQQPVIVSEEEAKRFAEEVGDPHKIAEFEGMWYLCDPNYPPTRISSKKSDTHVWPSLKENTEENKEYREKYPLVPCCLSSDQYTKKSSELRTYIARGGRLPSKATDVGGAEGDTTKKGKGKKDAGHVLGGVTILDPDRFGELPYNWERILGALGMEKVRRGKQTLYPILRYGVLSTPDSFLHCLELAFNPEYLGSSESARVGYVAGVRADLAKLDLSITRQESFGYTDVEMREILADVTRYIDPDIWVELANIRYRCNIFLYVVDKGHQNGEVVIPRSSHAHLPRPVDPTRPTVLIFKYSSDDSDYPYRCEIACDSTSLPLRFTFIDDDISTIAIDILEAANDVTVVTREGAERYRG